MYAKLGKQNRPHQAIILVGASKAKLRPKCFFLFMYRWTELRYLEEPFIWMVVSCTISSTMSRQKRTKVTGMTIVKKLVNLSGSFEVTAKFSWEPMELFRKGDAHVYLLQFVTILASVF